MIGDRMLFEILLFLEFMCSVWTFAIEIDNID